ncbi:MAG: ribosome small subunit-dependent GTPase A [Planctomycetota bacterium]
MSRDQSPEEKQRQLERFRRGMLHHVGHDEERRRKRTSKQRRAARGGSTPRARTWSDDELPFEKIVRGPQTVVCGTTSPADAGAAGLPQAMVAAVHHGRVHLDNGEVARVSGRLCVDPSFRLAVGDVVAYATTDGPARIEARLPRRTWLARPDPGNVHRELVLAANVDLGVIVVAAKDPPLRPGLIDRMLLALARGGVAAVVCVNKIDLLATDERTELTRTLAAYVDLGAAVVTCAAKDGEGIEILRRSLAGKTCVFVGHSGVGKSSLLNALDPGGTRAVGAVRAYDGRGRHTTTSSSLRQLGDGTRVIDTPGVRSFGLDAVDPVELRASFAEFDAFLGRCRFRDCLHWHEPDCAVREAAADGDLPPLRYASYLRILESTRQEG